MEWTPASRGELLISELEPFRKCPDCSCGRRFIDLVLTVHVTNIHLTKNKPDCYSFEIKVYILMKLLVGAAIIISAGLRTLLAFSVSVSLSLSLCLSLSSLAHLLLISRSSLALLSLPPPLVHLISSFSSFSLSLLMCGCVRAVDIF